MSLALLQWCQLMASRVVGISGLIILKTQFKVYHDGNDSLAWSCHWWGTTMMPPYGAPKAPCQCYAIIMLTQDVGISRLLIIKKQFKVYHNGNDSSALLHHWWGATESLDNSDVTMPTYSKSTFSMLMQQCQLMGLASPDY